MANHKEGLLDDIGDAAGAEVTTEAPEVTEPPSAAEAQPDAGTGAPDKPQRADTRPDGYVTKEERDRIAKERDEYRQRSQALEERTQKIIDRYFSERAEPDKAADTGPAPADPGPPPTDPQDYVGYIDWRRAKDAYDDHQRRQFEQQSQQQTESQRQFSAIWDKADYDLTSAAASDPSVGELYQGLINSYGRELVDGFGFSVTQAREWIEAQKQKIVWDSHRRGESIVDAVRRLATARGIASAPAPAPAGQQQVQPRDPATGQFVVSEAEKAEKARESQERNASLSSAPGAPVKKMTAAELAKMPEDEMWRQFESVGRRPGSKQFDREMGFR